DARTWRTSGPLFTVSGQMVERSTVGAAGFSRETAKPSAATTTTATPVQIINWRFLFCFKSGRAISITTCTCIYYATEGSTTRVENKQVDGLAARLNDRRSDRFQGSTVRFRTQAGGPCLTLSGCPRL